MKKTYSLIIKTLLLLALGFQFQNGEAACASTRKIGIAWGNPTKCNTYNFEATNALNGCFKFTWKILNSAGGVVVTKTGRTFSQAFSSNGSYSVKLTIADTCNRCDTVISKTLTVNCSNCSFAGLSSSLSIKCRTITLEAKNLNNGCLKYQYWVMGGSGTSSPITLSPGRLASYTFTTNGSYYTKLQVRDTCKGCDTFIYQQFSINCNPCSFVPDFTFTVDCRKVKFTATAKGAPGGISYSWTYGDGGKGTGANSYYSYVKDGVYKVCVLATWKDSITGETCKKEVCKEVKISCNAPCNIKGDFTFKVSAGGSVKFIASSNTGFTYTWTFGDGGTGTGIDPQYQYKKSGKYTACVKICDKTGRCCTTVCKTVIIEEPCNIRGSFTFKDLGNGKIQFQSYSSSAGATYTWDFGDGNTGTGTNPVNTYKKPGTYKVCVTIVSANKRCKTVICREVVVSFQERCNWSKAGFSATSTTKCGSYSLEAFNLADTCVSYSWTVNGVALDLTGGRLKTANFSSNGVYKICLKLTNKCRKCDTTICKEVKVDCFPKSCNWRTKAPDYTYSLKCPTLTIEGKNLNDGCIKYQFQILSASGTVLNTLNGRLVTANFTGNGDYYICMKLADTCNKCDTTICKKLTINCASPCNWKAAGAGFQTRVDCNKVSVFATDLKNGCVKYSWQTAGTTFGSGLNSGVTFNTNGTYTICLKLTDTCKKCDTSICQTVTINCCTAKALFRIDSVSKKGVLYVTNLSTGAFSYIWNWGDSTYSKDKSPGSHAYKYSGSKKICLTVYDSLAKCSTTYCLTYQVVVGRSQTSPFSISGNSTSGMSIFPNPANQLVNIQWPGSANRIVLRTTTGAEIWRGEVSGNHYTLKTDQFKEGTYIVEILGEATHSTGILLLTR